MRPAENINENKKSQPLQILTLGYAERPVKEASKKKSRQSHISDINKENSRLIENQSLDARQVELTKPLGNQSRNCMPRHMIVSKTASRRNCITPSSSNDEFEDSIHPVESLFQSINDPNKYQLKPLPSEIRSYRNPHNQPNKMDEIFNIMKERCAEMNPSQHISQPIVKSVNDPKLRNIVNSVLSKNSNTSIRNNFDDLNYNNYKSLYETSRPQVLDEDPFGSQPGNDIQILPNDDPPVVSSSAIDIGTQTDFSNWCASRGTQTQQQEIDNYNETNLCSHRCSSCHRIGTTIDNSFDESPVARNYKDSTLYSRASSSTHFRIDSARNSYERRYPIGANHQNHRHYRRPPDWSSTPFFIFEPHPEKGISFQDDFPNHRAALAFATSTPVRFEPSSGTTRSPALWDSSSTSSSQTIAEERIQVTMLVKRKEE